MALLKSFILPGYCVADIGANVGAYTKEFSPLVGSAGNVYAFEPIAENYDILEAVARKAHLSNVHLFPVALGSASGQRDMVIPEAEAFTGFYLAHLAGPTDLGRRVTVNVLTLDGLWKTAAIGRLHFIKCDAEGGELDIILGALELIRSDRPGWLLEVSRDNSTELFRLLQGLGYRAFVYNGQKLTPTEGYRDKQFSNYFFFHPDSKIWSRAINQN